MSRCLVVDVGNTSTAIGLVAGRRVRGARHVQGGIRDLRACCDALAELTQAGGVEGSVIASVVPKATPQWQRLLRKSVPGEPLVVTHRLDLGVAVRYPNPGAIGADRLANASGASALYGCPVIVADFGTALTFDIVSRDGAYVGGVIAPGLPLMTEYLYEKTALLPLIELRGPCAPVGRNTEAAMRIGAQVGYRGMVREIVSHLTAANDLPNVRLCATGGYARWALRGIDLPFAFAPTLTLLGLGRIFNLNRGQTGAPTNGA
jgi:type III pantothenate kinase